MPELKIFENDKSKTIVANEGEVLLDILRYHNHEVYSPCGGDGTCGKCVVYIRNMGYVTSCLYPIEEDIEIVLPDTFESNILAAQYKHTREVLFSPGGAAGLSTNPYGVAIDLGTTTIVLHLVDLKTDSLIVSRTVMNPQTGYGADVVSRINYCMTLPEGLTILQSKLMDGINKEFRGFMEDFTISQNDIVRIVISGNTTMLHILSGINPEPLAFYPFTPIFTDSKYLDARYFRWLCHPKAVVETLPSLSAYIGADIMVGIASLLLPFRHKNTLFIDIGTNGEIALITPEKIYCCATAAGPAFEGAKIEHGMGAVTGAICSYQGIDDFHVIGNVKPLGMCGSGLIDIIDYMLKKGVLEKNGYLKTPYSVIPAEKSGLLKDIVVTPQDVRELQLAKGAISAGIRLLTDYAGLTMDEIDAVYIGGGFGNQIRIESAVGIGLFPEKFADKLIPVGNTSGTGALLALRSTKFAASISEIRERAIVFELTEDDRFLTEFTTNMDFPDENYNSIK
jgi:uncharacterized 2Fe-2S/4Fe-4S cluster protein (DUF4445 family)